MKLPDALEDRLPLLFELDATSVHDEVVVASLLKNAA